MKIHNPFQYQLSTKGYVVMDGALATELQHRGCDLNDPLWSAKVLIEKPELITQVHYDYFMAGADCAITASYQATPLGFAKKGLTIESSISLIQQSVKLAQNAKLRYLSDINQDKPLVIAGSVGPYGAYLADGSEYTGNYQLAANEMRDFHYARIQALIEAGVDILACETMPSFAEIKVLLEIIKSFPHIPCWFSFTLKDAAHLSDGTPLQEVVALLDKCEQVLSIGINCIALDKVTAALATLGSLTTKPLIVYPNSGEEYDAKTKQWITSHHHHTLTSQVYEWQKLGAKLIGGCCRTTPNDIKELVETLSRNVI